MEGWGKMGKHGSKTPVQRFTGGSNRLTSWGFWLGWCWNQSIKGVQKGIVEMLSSLVMGTTRHVADDEVMIKTIRHPKARNQKSFLCMIKTNLMDLRSSSLSSNS
jgi:hypothetical protein